jgi:hypothetical protein
VLLLGVLAFPSSAAAVWTAPFNLSGAGQQGSYPRVGVDSTGDAVFAWTRPDPTTDCGSGFPCTRVQGRARSATGTLSAVQNISSATKNVFQSQVAVDPNGNAVFVWSQNFDVVSFQIRARRRSASGALGAIKAISGKIPLPGGSFAIGGRPVVGVDSNGNAVIAWERRDTAGDLRIQARGLSAGGSLSTIQTISPSGQHAYSPDIAVAPNGDAVVVWNSSDKTTNCSGGTPCVTAKARARTAAGGLSAVQTLSSGGGQATQSNADQLPQVGVDSSGNASFAWRRPDQTTDCGGAACNHVWTRARSATGTLSTVQSLVAQRALPPAQPRLDVDPNGNAVYAFVALDSSGFNRVNTRVRSAAGTLSATQIVSDAGGNLPSIGVDTGGNAVFDWVGLVAGNDRIQARTRAADGTLGTITTLSAAGQNAREPQIAVAPNGVAAADWRRFDGTTSSCCYRIQGAAGP